MYLLSENRHADFRRRGDLEPEMSAGLINSTLRKKTDVSERASQRGY
jgi:hypothetical protein